MVKVDKSEALDEIFRISGLWSKAQILLLIQPLGCDTCHHHCSADPIMVWCLMTCKISSCVACLDDSIPYLEVKELGQNKTESGQPTRFKNKFTPEVTYQSSVGISYVVGSLLVVSCQYLFA